GWTHSWGGDGEFKHPATRFDILIENRGGNHQGELYIDEVKWLYSVPPTTSEMAVATYAESRFGEDNWRCEGPAGWRYDRNRWCGRFQGEQTTAGIHLGRSILGRPRALRLTVVSDGSGHELRAVVGSHFQAFERSLGTLDTPGEQTLVVPMRDMRTWEHYAGENDGIVRYPLRFERLLLKRAGADPAVDIVLRKLEFETEYEIARPVTLVPSVKRRDDGTAEFAVALRSLRETSTPALVRCVIRDSSGVLELGEGRITVPPLGRTEYRREVAMGDHEVLEAVFTCDGEGFAARPASVTIARDPEVPDEPAIDSDSRVGSGLYLYRDHGQSNAPAQMERMCRLAAAAGVKWTREELNWRLIEPRQGEFDFEFFDTMVETAQRHGISVYGLLCYSTPWCQPPITDEFIEHYCRYVRAMVGRYGERIKYWEIWNEPNIFFWPGPKERYPVLLKRAYETVKAVDPDAQVLGCSTAGIDTTFIQMVVEQGAPFDALTIHPYRHDLNTHAFMNELRAVRELVGGRDVWITEMGWPSHIGGLSEREQAGYVARTYIAALASGAVRSVSWYDFREDGADPFYNEHHFGLVRGDLTPKAGYRALATVGSLLGSTRIESELELGDGLTGFVFADGSRRIAIVWSDEATQVVRLKFGADDVALLDFAGMPVPCLRERDATMLRLERGLPIFIVTDGPLHVGVQPPPLRIVAEPTRVHPGETVRVQWQCATELTVGRPTCPSGWKQVDAAGDGVALLVPEDAPRGGYGVDVPVEFGEVHTVIPVRVEVVPVLLRG
ncbi:MAG: beta-galactosidase, partial [Phycisphaerae bacterium]|nr:beta-galactosidase [Phycisphaerae bacterium]